MKPSVQPGAVPDSGPDCCVDLNVVAASSAGTAALLGIRLRSGGVRPASILAL